MKKRMVWTLVFCLVLIFASVQCQLLFPASHSGTNNQQGNQPINNQQGNNQQENNQQENNNLQGDNQDPGLMDFDLTGIWELTTSTANGDVYSELILENTGTFSQQVTWGDMMTYDTGTYVVMDGFIHFYVDHHEPQYYQGQPMSYVTSFSYYYTPYDANTMLFEDHTMGTSWWVYRE